MQRSEWNAVMQRWMHRRDLDADLDTVFELTHDRVNARLLVNRNVDLGEPFAARLFVHAGLAHLAELVQDDKQFMREQRAFEDAVVDFHLAASLAEGLAQMGVPYAY